MKIEKVLLIAAVIGGFAFWTKKSFASSANINAKGVTKSATVGASPINTQAVAKVQDQGKISTTPTVRLAVDPITGARLLPLRFGLPAASAFQNPKARAAGGDPYRISDAAAASAPLRTDYAFNYRSTVAPTAKR